MQSGDIPSLIADAVRSLRDPRVWEYTLVNSAPSKKICAEQYTQTNTTTSDPAAPNPELIALLPIYKPMSSFPTAKSKAVTVAPAQTSFQAIFTLGINL